MNRVLLMAFLMLAACDGPSPHFRNSSVTRITVVGSVFDVRVRGNIAESIRVNAQYAPRLGPIRERAGAAMQRVSGCAVEYVLGDASVQVGLLNCGSDAPDWAAILRRGTGQYDCIQVDSWFSSSAGVIFSEFECDPY